MLHYATKLLLKIIGIDKYFVGLNHILKNYSITVRKGEPMVLIGPSSSGKSMLRRCVNLLERVDECGIFFDNRSIYGNDIKPHRYTGIVARCHRTMKYFLSVGDGKHHASR